MNITIEIDSTNVAERQINSEKGTFKVRNQIGWLRIPGKRYPQEIIISLEADQAPFAEGTYRLLSESVTIDKYKRIAFQRSLALEKTENDSIKAVETQ